MHPDQVSPTDPPAPRRLLPGDPALAGLLLLLQGAFSYMDGRIDPPSSMLELDAAAIQRLAAEAEIWAIGQPAVACVILSQRPDCLYLGKLAVMPNHRGRGLARLLVGLAESRALALGLPAIELQTRVELLENHATFVALGFQMVGETAHPGFDRPTSLTFRRPVPAPS